MRYHVLRVLVVWLGWLAGAHADTVDELVTAEMQRQHIPGLSIAVVRDGRILREQGYGLANLEHEVPVTPRTVFQSGSVGKQFTAALTLLLAEDGKVQLDAPIATYLAGTPPAWARITVRQLLNHTAGLANYDERLDLRRDYTEQELLASIAQIPLVSMPGEKFGYSNLGYQLLGFLCSKAGGKFYGDQLRERIFAPSGMQASIISERNIVPHRAAGYEWADGGLVNQEWIAPTLNTTGDGSLYLTAHDLALWSITLESDQVLSKSIKDASWSPATLNDGSRSNYGFGWDLGSTQGHRWVQHAGAWQGFTSFIIRYVDDRLAVVVLVNRADARPEMIAARIVRYYLSDLRVPVPTAKTFAAVPLFLRGSMNAWGVRDRLRRVAEGRFEVTVALEAGDHSFRISSQDWRSIDFAAPFDSPPMQLQNALRLEPEGADLSLKVAQSAQYLFQLDVREPQAPRLTIVER